jgi:hypothetical protein
MSDEDDFSDDGMMMQRPGGSSIVRREFFEKIINPKEPLTVIVPEQDNWRLVVSQVRNPCNFTGGIFLVPHLFLSCRHVSGNMVHQTDAALF